MRKLLFTVMFVLGSSLSQAQIAGVPDRQIVINQADALIGCAAYHQFVYELFLVHSVKNGMTPKIKADIEYNRRMGNALIIESTRLYNIADATREENPPGKQDVYFYEIMRRYSSHQFDVKAAGVKCQSELQNFQILAAHLKGAVPSFDITDLVNGRGR